MDVTLCKCCKEAPPIDESTAYCEGCTAQAAKEGYPVEFYAEWEG